MSNVRRSSLPFALVLLALVPGARARGQTFVGSTDVTAPNFIPATDLARCGANPPNVLLPFPIAAGTSNFGAFTATANNCVNRTSGSFFNGLFTFDFGGGRTLFGTYSGTIALPLPPVVGAPAAISELLTITGGTGAFAGAGGVLTATGAETENADNTFNLHLNMTGTVSTAPEPGTVLLCATGLCIVGVGARRRRGAARRTAGRRQSP
jgi:hypothetical protein